MAGNGPQTTPPGSLIAVRSRLSDVGDKGNAMEILQSVNHADAEREAPARAPGHMLSPEANGTMCLHSNRPGAAATARGATQEVHTPMSRKRTPRKHRIIRTRGQRIAWTNTSAIPDDEVVGALKCVAGHVDLHRTVVHVKTYGRGGYIGTAYPNIPLIAGLEGLERWEWRYLIVVRVGALDDWRHTLAHEAKHVEQYREGLRRSEASCNAFADWMMEKWA